MYKNDSALREVLTQHLTGSVLGNYVNFKFVFIVIQVLISLIVTVGRRRPWVAL